MTAQAVGWVVKAEPGRVGLHGSSTLGRPREHPTIALGIVDTPVRPFYAMAPENAGRSFGSAERAGACFAEMTERFHP